MILFTTSCTRTNEQLLQAEQLIETSPDSAMTILNKYSYNKLSDKDKALYGLVYTRVNLSKKILLKSDSFINFSIDYFERTNEKERIAASYFYKGRLFKYASDFETAMDCYLKSLDNISGLKDYKLLGRLNMDIGEIHFYQNNFISALNNFQKADSNFIKAGLQPQSFSCKMNIGRCYKAKEEYLTALNYNLNTIKFAQDLFQKGSVMQEIGINYNRLGKFDSALLYLKRVLDFPNYENNKSIRYYHLADLFFEMKQYDSAVFYSKRTLQKNPDLRTRKECFRILVNCKTIKGDIPSLNYYMSKYQDCDDSIRKIDLQTKGSYIETMHNTQKDAEKSRNWIWYISVLAILIIVLSILFYIRKHRKGIQTIKTIEEKQLVQKKESVQEIVERTKEALHKSLKEKRIELTKKIKQNTPDGRHEMILQLYDELVHFKNKQHFKNEMDNTLNNLYSKLETSYPKLKTKEKQWACLNMLEIPNEESMQLLDYNTEAYKKMKQRFAQKIGVDAVANIDAVLEKILYDAT